MPHGNGPNGNHRDTPSAVETAYRDSGLDEAVTARSSTSTRRRQPKAQTGQLATLSGGNHFIELCLDEADRVWVMLHQGSRGSGNRIGQYFIERAREECSPRTRLYVPDKDLAFFMEGEELFDDYVAAVGWAQGLSPARQPPGDDGAALRMLVTTCAEVQAR
ncbi:MAG: RtcB family protein [Hyphomonadaceae bacterium]